MKAFYIKHIHRIVPNEIDQDYHRILLHYSTYYSILSEKSQQTFRLRLYHLLNILSFSSEELPSVTREMRAVIGSSIIQITFGLSSYLPTKYTNIVVKPHRYMYPGFGEPFLGHIDFDNATIYFSWQDVKEGYQYPNDAVNVALHEMAHVIEAEDGFDQIFNWFFKKIEWAKWAELAFKKMHVIRSGNNRFLKDYGGINMREMFSVCIETFFEQPEEFKRRLPEIYNTLADLLNQDPALMNKKA
ncbi:MAG: Mlc titration factor MtfA (ptsG expression regulator) [Saprospiraceae bacterium]|jgi:Mlc titration factor MtfA (ptsG expression regulator)